MARASGILLHPTSLPGAYGIGDLGKEAYRFVDFLIASGQHLWQMLPLGPPGYGNSPYQCHSAFAGNPLLISLEKLADDGLLKPSDLEKVPLFPEHRVDFQAVSGYKIPLLNKAFHEFKQQNGGEKENFELFTRTNMSWLEPYSFFMALKEIHNLTAWNTWPEDIRKRRQSTLIEWESKLEEKIGMHRFLQYQFFKQWTELKKYCNNNGIKLIGDMSIFLALDSADIWTQPEMFFLNDDGQPTVVAGVPPDYFSKTGQLWGNPLYRWEVMKADGYRWWTERFRVMFNIFDIVRIDHFRGLAQYWAVPGKDKTAENGEWQPGPGATFFETICKELGTLPIIAEDLGIITPDVEALRDKFGFPGMRVLQFAWSGDPKKNIHLPHLHIPNCIVYTGTHDNTPVLGWFRSEDIGETTQSREERMIETQRALKYIYSNGDEVNWDFIRLAMMSVADTAIIPLQDILGLGNEARMNTPATSSGNWNWRFTAEMLTEETEIRLNKLTYIYGR